MNKILIDTNAYSNLLRGNQAIADTLSQAAEIILSVVVVAELYTGFKGGQKESENRHLLLQFMEKPGVRLVPIEQTTATIFSEIKHNLKKKGRPIPINDIWIAAHNIEFGSALMTFDQHFEAIDGLRIWSA